MSHRGSLILVLGLLLTITVACTNKKSVNPLAGIGSKQPDKVLFDKSMDAMKHNRFDVARMTLQTLITTYPDSEFVARAKLAVGDSWYAEGGTASLAQAEQEYRDFITFFPNMPEAAEAQLKIANIQYQQMEKADRDYTHAKRAEDEYRNVILQFPDSKLVPEAKQRLLEVQEVLADREFDIGRFYYLRQSYPASIARLQSLVDKYPLYSKADEALYLLGQNYEAQIDAIRSKPTCTKANPQRGCVMENAKADYIEALSKDAGAAYSKIITRYPAMNREDDAKKRLEALHQPVPRTTKAALALNRAEEDSRRENTTMGKLIGVVKKGPDVSEAAKVGEPTLVDPTPVSANQVVGTTMRQAMGVATGEHGLAVETVKGVEPGPNQPTPRSDTATAIAPAAGAPATSDQPFARPAATAADPNELKPSATPDANELQPNAAPDANELKPTPDAQAATAGDQPLPPPVQVNEIQPGQSGGAATASAVSSSSLATDQEISSSKKKKKKGMKKIIPF
ncbi:MAG: outer membrane protein assembly factor BamD [Candidatus Sulfotelmatobacter sp.]